MEEIDTAMHSDWESGWEAAGRGDSSGYASGSAAWRDGFDDREAHDLVQRMGADR